MDLIWIEDLLVLLKERNFSIAAEKRSISQPAFSRRIRSLEAWLGVPLVDRASKPIRFTVPADSLEADCRTLVNQVYGLRNTIRGAQNAPRPIRICAQQALTISVFPDLTRAMKKALPKATFRVRSANYDDCIAMFLRRYVDLLLCYRTARTGAKIPDSFAREITLGDDLLIPVAHETVNAGIAAEFTNSRPLPLLSYPENSFLGEVVRKDCLAHLIPNCDFEIVCESSFSAGLKEMAMKGMGIAWLPRRLVSAELDSKALVELSSELGSVELQVLLYWNYGAQPQLSIAALESLHL